MVDFDRLYPVNPEGGKGDDGTLGMLVYWDISLISRWEF
jgi:hypothetical protein